MTRAYTGPIFWRIVWTRTATGETVTQAYQPDDRALARADAACLAKRDFCEGVILQGLNDRFPAEVISEEKFDA